MGKDNAKHSATIHLPKGGRRYWTDVFRGTAPPDPSMAPGQVLVFASATFGDGTRAALWIESGPGGANSFGARVYDAKGAAYPGWPIDLSDAEDFEMKRISFDLREGAEDGEYLLEIVEVGE
jgi:hypothetical protein